MIRVGNPSFDLISKGLSKRLDRRQKYPAILAVHGAPLSGGIVHKVIHPVWLRLTIDVDAVHAQHLNQELPLQGRAWDVIQIHTCRGIIVPNSNSKILGTQTKSAQRIDVFHHQIPQWRTVSIFQEHPCHRTLEHFQQQGPRRHVSVLTQGSHLIGLALQRVLIRHRQNLCIVQRLTQADEAQAVVVGELCW